MATDYKVVEGAAMLAELDYNEFGDALLAYWATYLSDNVDPTFTSTVNSYKSAIEYALDQGDDILIIQLNFLRYMATYKAGRVKDDGTVVTDLPTILQEAIGKSTWTRIPADGIGGPVDGAPQAGDYVYAEHFNEVVDVAKYSRLFDIQQTQQYKWQGLTTTFHQHFDPAAGSGVQENAGWWWAANNPDVQSFYNTAIASGFSDQGPLDGNTVVWSSTCLQAISTDGKFHWEGQSDPGVQCASWPPPQSGNANNRSLDMTVNYYDNFKIRSKNAYLLQNWASGRTLEKGVAWCNSWFHTGGSQPTKPSEVSVGSATIQVGATAAYKDIGAAMAAQWMNQQWIDVDLDEKEVDPTGISWVQNDSEWYDTRCHRIREKSISGGTHYNEWDLWTQIQMKYLQVKGLD